MERACLRHVGSMLTSLPYTAAKSYFKFTKWAPKHKLYALSLYMVGISVPAPSKLSYGGSTHMSLCLFRCASSLIWMPISSWCIGPKWLHQYFLLLTGFFVLGCKNPDNMDKEDIFCFLFESMNPAGKLAILSRGVLSYWNIFKFSDWNSE